MSADDVQDKTFGHRGRKDDPLYGARRLLTKAHERLDPTGDGSCAVCSTRASHAMRCAWPGTPKKSSARSTNSTTPTRHASSSPAERRSARPQLPTGGALAGPDVASLARPHRRLARSTRDQRTDRSDEQPHQTDQPHGFGFRRLRHYRLRALLYAGRPNWALLATVTPR